MIHPFRRFELWLLNALPVMITLLLVLIFLMSKHSGGLSRFMPILPLIPVFYWGMMQAREMPYWFVFLLGLVMDAVTGVPMGLSSLLYIMLLALLHTQRKFIHKEGFVIKWAYFALVLAVIASLNWILLSVFYGRAATLGPAFLQWLLTVCCYPIFHRLFDGLYHYVHSRRWQVLHGV